MEGLARQMDDDVALPTWHFFRPLFFLICFTIEYSISILFFSSNG